jgi:hypothetical protein
VFDKSQYFHDLPATLPWIGAIFGFTYVALYARFSSQFAYLAGVYNQIMATQAQIAGTAPTPAQQDPDSNEKIQIWMAGFVEDRLDLHLDRRSSSGGEELLAWANSNKPESNAL